MKKIFLFILTLSLKQVVVAQSWQQENDYVIDVVLNDKEKTLDAFEKIIYTNHSPDTLFFIWFHLWPNAYKNDQTAFSDQLLRNGSTKFYFSDKKDKGYINRLDFKADGLRVKTEDHPEHIDIIKLILPQPLPPQQQVVITTPFHVQLPFNFSRGGYDGEAFQITQWYPKPAVYDTRGWHPMPYLDQGEFYSEFGSYDVRITLPENYVIAASGTLVTPSEQQWLKERTSEIWGMEYNRQFQQKKKINSASVSSSKKRTTQKPNTKELPQVNLLSSLNTKTIRYLQDSVHDFAWFADKRFIMQSDTCQLASGRTITVNAFYTPHEQLVWKHSVSFTKDAIRFYSTELGEYPYNVVSVVQGPESFGGGMEYPTITIISPVVSLKSLDEVIAHEVGHNWLYGILASHERAFPWMDEGMNTFYEKKYITSKYGSTPSINELVYQTKVRRRTAQSIGTGSEKFSEKNYALAAYDATSTWMRQIEKLIGENRFRDMMHQYFDRWKFHHPQPDDFKNLAATYLKQDQSILRFIDTPYLQLYHGFRILTPVKKNTLTHFLQNPVKNVMILSPALGINAYDKLMLGGLITSYKIPPNNFNYLLIAMYGTGSGNLTGLGKMNYTIHSNSLIRKTDFFINGSTFTMDQFSDSAGRKLIMNFKKLVPGARVTFRERNPLSRVRQYLQWKTYFFTEQFLRIVPDTNISGTDTSLFLHYFLPKENRYLNQLKFVYENDRILYPFDFTLQIEQAKDFIRPALTAHYYFNYRDGGLQARLFAGKFIYLGDRNIAKQFLNDRFFLNMSGPNGFEDYTYSDYFIGRNKFDVLESQQIMIRDGGFKTRTDLLAGKVGKTDNWLAAINLSASIPKRYNPLSVLPFHIPLHVFADMGTYAEAWERGSDTDRFLYSVGFHLPLFNETLNIYIPVLYNQVYANYYKSTIPKNRFLKTISFQINFYNSDLRKINHELEF